MSKKVKDYIQKNWKKTIHEVKDAENWLIKPKTTFSVSGIVGVFVDFYYWDTYFTNIGLILDGLEDQAENNLENMAYFIQKLGYVPNANHLLDRSQPPLFTRSVYDLYKHTGNQRLIEKYASAMIAEQEFFRLDRMTEIGLSAHKTNTLRSSLKEQYGYLSERLGETRETEEEQIAFAYDLLSIAESGWDFNFRFRTPDNNFAAHEFAHLDLNCILYDAEQKLAEMLFAIGSEEQAKIYQKRAVERKMLIDRYLLDSNSGIYYDYNFKRKEFSSLLSCISFYPYAMDISKNQESAKAVLKRLELSYGLSACEYRGETNEYLQWDYPAMWPSNVYFAYVGLKNLGLLEDAKRIATKYLDTVDRNFETTGLLWEKYDAQNGLISVTREYETQPLLDWTAGVYRYLEEDLKN